MLKWKWRLLPKPWCHKVPFRCPFAPTHTLAPTLNEEYPQWLDEQKWGSQAWFEVEFSIQFLAYSTLSFSMRYPALYSVKEIWLRILGWSPQIREASKIWTIQRPPHLLEDPLLELSWSLTFPWLLTSSHPSYITTHEDVTVEIQGRGWQSGIVTPCSFCGLRRP